MPTLTFISPSPLVKTDVSSIVYQGEPLKPYFRTVPVNVVFQLPIDPRIWSKFSKHLGLFLSSDGKVDSITLDTLFTFQNTLTSKRVLSSAVQKIREIPELTNTPILLDLASKTWQTLSGLKYLRSLGVVLTTAYLENNLVMPGWAGKRPSKRLPYPLLHFEPEFGGSIHIVLTGSMGPGMGSYDFSLPKPLKEKNLLDEIVSEIMKVSRKYSLSRIWIEFQNIEGRLDYPLPATPLSFPDIDIDIMVVPFLPRNKIKCCSNDQLKVMEEWTKLVEIMDGLAY